MPAVPDQVGRVALLCRRGSLGRVPEPGRRCRCVFPVSPAIAESRHAPISMGYAVDIDDGYIPSLWVRFWLQQSLVGTLGPC
jgi:hypothetical protein